MIIMIIMIIYIYIYIYIWVCVFGQVIISYSFPLVSWHYPKWPAKFHCVQRLIGDRIIFIVLLKCANGGLIIKYYRPGSMISEISSPVCVPMIINSNTKYKQWLTLVYLYFSVDVPKHAEIYIGFEFRLYLYYVAIFSVSWNIVFYINYLIPFHFIKFM